MMLMPATPLVHLLPGITSGKAHAHLPPLTANMHTCHPGLQCANNLHYLHTLHVSHCSLKTMVVLILAVWWGVHYLHTELAIEHCRAHTTCVYLVIELAHYLINLVSFLFGFKKFCKMWAKLYDLHANKHTGKCAQPIQQEQ